MNQPTNSLSATRVLILEDDYYLATDLQNVLQSAGAAVAGPFPDEAAATRSISEARPDCAFVDINLGHGPTFELPRALMRLDIPFCFVTGYDAGTIPSEFDAVSRLEKPIDARKIVGVVAGLLGKDGTITR